LAFGHSLGSRKGRWRTRRSLPFSNRGQPLACRRYFGSFACCYGRLLRAGLATLRRRNLAGMYRDKCERNIVASRRKTFSAVWPWRTTCLETSGQRPLAGLHRPQTLKVVSRSGGFARNHSHRVLPGTVIILWCAFRPKRVSPPWLFIQAQTVVRGQLSRWPSREDHEGRKASETAGNEIEPLASGGGADRSGRVICPSLAAQRRSIRLTICCGNLISSIVIAPF
jgi:hypothetical protein